MSNSLPSVDCSPPGFSVHGVFLTRILEWVVISFSCTRNQISVWNQTLAWQVNSIPLSHQGSLLACSRSQLKFAASYSICLYVFSPKIRKWRSARWEQKLQLSNLPYTISLDFFFHLHTLTSNLCWNIWENINIHIYRFLIW